MNITAASTATIFGLPNDVVAMAGTFTILATAVGLAWKGIHPVIRHIRRTLGWVDEFREAWEGTPVDPDKPWLPRTPGVLERLNKLDGEFADDGNGSLKSSVRRIEASVGRLEKAVTSIAENQTQIVETLDRLDGRITQLETARIP